MAFQNYRAIGINEVGHIAGSQEISWGATQQEGVVLALTTESADLQCAQVRVLENTTLVSATIGVQVNLCQGELEKWQFAWGMPDTALTGDLAASTPVAEVLTFEGNNMGEQERRLYVKAPGPVGIRRVDIPRAKVQSLGNMAFASNAYSLPSAEWQIVRGDTNVIMTITDQV